MKWKKINDKSDIPAGNFNYFVKVRNFRDYDHNSTIDGNKGWKNVVEYLDESEQEVEIKSEFDIETAANICFPLDDPRKNMHHDNQGQYQRREAFKLGAEYVAQFKHSVPVPERNEKAVNDWQQNLYDHLCKQYDLYPTVDEMNTIQHIVYPPKYPYTLTDDVTVPVESVQDGRIEKVIEFCDKKISECSQELILIHWTTARAERALAAKKSFNQLKEFIESLPKTNNESSGEDVEDAARKVL